MIENPTQRKARLAAEAAALASFKVEKIAEGRSAIAEQRAEDAYLAAENAAEAERETYCGSRAAGLSREDAWNDAQAARRNAYRGRR